MKRLAIIGASDFQNPLIEKAKSMGVETHVFAWAAGDIGESTADYFYPQSIVEKESILETCLELNIDGICSIGSDLANITVAYVADNMGLTGNSYECVLRSTNKYEMREAFARGGDPSPLCALVDDTTDLEALEICLPSIVKPIDRSGSRGVTKISSRSQLAKAVEAAFAEGFERKALVEAFLVGEEFSVECISWQGTHTLLAVTKKFTTGAPHFIETGHMEPAQLDVELIEDIRTTVFHALDTLGVEYGASHSEIMIAPNGSISIVEIGSRMGGDCIGSSLVELSTGVDFVRAVIDMALGKQPTDLSPEPCGYALIRFIFDEEDRRALEQIKANSPDVLIFESSQHSSEHMITDSSNRYGFFIIKCAAYREIEPFLPLKHEQQ